MLRQAPQDSWMWLVTNSLLQHPFKTPLIPSVVFVSVSSWKPHQSYWPLDNPQQLVVIPSIFFHHLYALGCSRPLRVRQVFCSAQLLSMAGEKNQWCTAHLVRYLGLGQSSCSLGLGAQGLHILQKHLCEGQAYFFDSYKGG